MGVRILLSTDNNPESYALYVDAIRACGAEPTRMYCPVVSTDYDGLIVCGGVDVHPARYGEAVDGAVNMDEARDAAEIALMEAFLKAGKPIFGICRGHQVVNVWAGGGIIQDLGEQNAIHRHDGCDKVHLVSACCILRELYDPLFRVNSAHHQGVGPVGRGLKVTAPSADGIIEAMEHCTLPIFTTQFHPERMNGIDTAPGDRIFRWFIEKSGCL